MWPPTPDTLGSEVNDVLVDMVDALDELDTHIVKGQGPRMRGTGEEQGAVAVVVVRR